MSTNCCKFYTRISTDNYFILYLVSAVIYDISVIIMFCRCLRKYYHMCHRFDIYKQTIQSKISSNKLCNSASSANTIEFQIQ